MYNDAVRRALHEQYGSACSIRVANIGGVRASYSEAILSLYLTPL